VIEVVAQEISRTVKRSTEFESARLLAFRDALTGLPNLEQLKQFAESEATQGYFSQPFTVLFLDVDQLRVLNERFGRDAGDAALAHVVAATRSTLRGADILFRLGSDEFVVLLTKTDADTATGIADRISNNVTATQLLVRDGSRLTIRLSIGIATSPGDGTSLTELIGIARARVILPPEEQPKAHRLPRSVH
jgi:diguanylate cyclase (GGDEF)-like protein